MGKINWSENQVRAIESSGNNFLVSAAAGSGKTAVLVERIIQKITSKDDPISVERFLVMTFTKAAAAEMKERINNTLDELVDKDPDNEYLKRQQVLIKKANIETIDSFCMQTLKRFFDKAGVDPNFEICDEAENTYIKQTIFEELLEEKLKQYYASDGQLYSDFYAMLQIFGGENGQALFNLVEIVNRAMESQAFPKIWLKEAVKRYVDIDKLPFDEIKWIKDIKKSTFDISRSVFQSCSELHVTCSQIASDSKLQKVLDDDFEKLKELRDVASSGTFDEIQNAILEFEFLRSPRKENDISDLYSARKQYQEEYKSIEKYFSYGNSQEIVTLMKSIGEYLQTLELFINELNDNADLKKKQLAKLTFSDVEQACVRLFIECDENGLPVLESGKVRYTDTARLYSEMFDEILVDEYQDSNDIQEKLVQAITSRACGNVFMVGDVKQSIYSFRGSDAHLFLDKNERYERIENLSDNLHENNKENQGVIINLDANFRSNSGVLKGINDVFFSVMSANAGDVEYDVRESLKYGASFLYGESTLLDDALINSTETNVTNQNCENPYVPSMNDFAKANIELNFVDFDSINDDADNPEEQFVIECAVMAKRAKQLVEGDPRRGIKPFMVTQKDGNKRPARYGDIAMLMRSKKRKLIHVVNAIEQEGICVESEPAGDYCNRPEVSVILALLRVILNPQDDISLLTIMRSPIYNFSITDIAQVRIQLREGFIYDSIKAFRNRFECNNEKEFELMKRVEKLILDIETWRQKDMYLSLSELVWDVFETSGYYAYNATCVDGEIRQSNLRYFFNKAKEFEKQRFASLTSFIHYLDKLSEKNITYFDAPAVSIDENAIHVMSIHKSKGLEFPIVFLLNCEKRGNFTSATSSFFTDPEYGIACSFSNFEENSTCKTLFQNYVSKHTIEYQTSEELRILYVAMTRAREKLIVSCSVPKPSSPNKCIQKAETLAKSLVEHTINHVPKIKHDAVLSVSSYITWILAAVFLLKDEDFVRQMKQIMNKNLSEKNIDFQLDNSNNSCNSENSVCFQNSECSQNSSYGELYTVSKDRVWAFKLHNKDSVFEENQDYIIDDENIAAENMYEELVDIANKYGRDVDESFEKMKADFEWKYPKTATIGSRVKVSVTEVMRDINKHKREIQEEIELGVEIPLFKQIKESERGSELNNDIEHASNTQQLNYVYCSYRKPYFANDFFDGVHLDANLDRELTPAELGSAYHSVMSNIDFEHSEHVCPNTFAELTDDLVKRSVLTKNAAKHIDCDLLARFSKTKLFNRIRKANMDSHHIAVEQPFLLEYQDVLTIPQNELSEMNSHGLNEEVIELLMSKNVIFIQGVIDLFFVEDGEIVLVDYKTNKVTPNNVHALKKKYDVQFTLYKYALERLTGMRCKEGLMYMLTYTGQDRIPEIDDDNCIKMF